MSYRIDETSKLVLDRMREQAESAARVQSSNVADNYSAPQQFVVGRLVGMATITDVGEDDDSVHWAWEFALRDHDTGKFVACGQGSDLYGECVIADGGVGAIGINGLLYVQQNDDDGTTLILVPISAGFQGRITSVSGSFPVWNYTVQRVTKYDPSQTGPEAWVTDGKNITGVLNRFEWTPASYPYWHGAGVVIADSTGAVANGVYSDQTASACRTRPIGVGVVVDVSMNFDSDGNKYYSFAAPNSAQAD